MTVKVFNKQIYLKVKQSKFKKIIKEYAQNYKANGYKVKTTEQYNKGQKIYILWIRGN